MRLRACPCSIGIPSGATFSLSSTLNGPCQSPPSTSVGRPGCNASLFEGPASPPPFPLVGDFAEGPLSAIAFFTGFVALILFNAGAGDLQRDDGGGDGLRDVTVACAALPSPLESEGAPTAAEAVVATTSGVESC